MHHVFPLGHGRQIVSRAHARGVLRLGVALPRSMSLPSIGYNVRKVLTIAQHTTERLRRQYYCDKHITCQRLHVTKKTCSDLGSRAARLPQIRVRGSGCRTSRYLLARRAADLSDEALGNETCQKMLDATARHTSFCFEADRKDLAQIC